MNYRQTKKFYSKLKCKKYSTFKKKEKAIIYERLNRQFDPFISGSPFINLLSPVDLYKRSFKWQHNKNKIKLILGKETNKL